MFVKAAIRSRYRDMVVVIESSRVVLLLSAVYSKIMTKTNKQTSRNKDIKPCWTGIRKSEIDIGRARDFMQ